MHAAQGEPEATVFSAERDLIGHRIKNIQIAQNILIHAPPYSDHVPINE